MASSLAVMLIGAAVISMPLAIIERISMGRTLLDAGLAVSGFTVSAMVCIWALGVALGAPTFGLGLGILIIYRLMSGNESVAIERQNEDVKGP